ncbi:adenylosuccinate lyase [Rhodobacteraceae bacterium F11138]|nr:adenylosuccinate lyase [Rhodobacteraceae bacterium F11138]
MTIRTTILALALATAPALSFAMCADREHQAQSCAPGTVWDTNSQSCEPQANS